MGVKSHRYDLASASCVMVDWGNGRATIRNLYAEERRKGHARDLLASLCAAADLAGTTLLLRAGPYGDDPKPTTEQLIEFYTSLGFEQVIPGSHVHTYMERRPREKNTYCNEKKE